ncbi:MAG: hypothetical protein HZC55_02125 [Verrucomicrobia bacterium]|nr:hypothetical protein [Verrucomicrobiota bacterium]
MNFTGLPHSSIRTVLLLAAAAGLAFGQGAPRPGGPPRTEEVQTLIRTLESATAPQHEKVLACQRLAVLGPREAVPALATLLADEKLAHMARHALEPMEDPAAAAALRGAMGRLKGNLLVGVINSLGFRRDVAAVPALGGLIDHPEAEVARAAAAALGRIGTKDAAARLQAALGRATGAQRLALADASLTGAEGLARAGLHAEAAAIYDSLCGKAFPDYIRTAAMGGAILSRQAGGIPLLVQQIQGDDPALLSAGWRAARELAGGAVTRALAEQLPKLPAAKQVPLLQVLGDRGDPIALPAVLDLAAKGAGAVRVAALQALPRVDDGKAALPVLLQAVTAGGDAAEVALSGLGAIRGAEVDAKVLAALPTASPGLRAKLIGVLAARKADSARSELLKLAAGGDPDVAKAAFRALAVVARATDLPQLIRLSLATRDDAVKVPADLAVYAVSMKVFPAAKRPEAVLNALRESRDPVATCALLRPLGAILKSNGATPEAYAVVKTAFESKDPQVSATALRTLADWPDATPAALLLEVAKRDADGTRREVALGGGVRMAANVAAGRDRTPLDALAWFAQANQLVRSKEEKLMIVSGLGNVKRIEALRMLKEYLGDPAVQTEAALALVEIAPALATPEHAAEAKALLESIGKSTKDVDVRRKAGKASKSIQIVPKK